MAYRNVLFYDLRITTAAKKAVDHLPTAQELFETLAAFSDHNNAYREFVHGDVEVRIVSVSIDNNRRVAKLLVHQSDKTTLDTVYANLATRKRRKIEKEPGEGGEVSYHICIDLQEDTNKPNRYLCLVEKAATTNILRTASIINHIIKIARDENPDRFTYPDPINTKRRDGTVKRHRFAPRVDFDGHISSDFANQLAKGRMDFLDLVHDKSGQNFSGKTFLHEDHQTLVVKVDNVGSVKSRLDGIQNAMSKKAGRFQKAKLRFTREDGSSDSIPLDPDTGAPIGDKYVKRRRLGPHIALQATSVERPVRKFMQEMVDLVDQAR